MGYPEENVITLINDRAALGDFQTPGATHRPQTIQQRTDAAVDCAKGIKKP